MVSYKNVDMYFAYICEDSSMLSEFWIDEIQQKFHVTAKDYTQLINEFHKKVNFWLNSEGKEK